MPWLAASPQPWVPTWPGGILVLPSPKGGAVPVPFYSLSRGFQQDTRTPHRGRGQRGTCQKSNETLERWPGAGQVLPVPGGTPTGAQACHSFRGPQGPVARWRGRSPCSQRPADGRYQEGFRAAPALS